MNDEVDLAGVGVGPFNLSIAALADELPELRTRFFERRAGFAWHPGLLFPGSRMQTSFLKDLVTAVSPTNPHSFVNYLVQHGRFHAFLAAESSAIERREFADYLGWVAKRLPSLRFGVEVRELRSIPAGFELVHDRGRTRTKHVVLGTGRVPSVPECTRARLGERCFHAIDVLGRTLDLRGARVAVVGGGQTGAEILLELLRGRWGEPERVSWVSRRMNFEPLDESPFTNHLFTPGFVGVFHGLDRGKRAALLERHKLAGDGISLATLRELHDRVYERLVAREGPSIELLPGRELIELEPSHAGFELALENQLDGAREWLAADWVILCTGLREQLPACVEPLLPELELDERGGLQVGERFEVRRRSGGDERLYVVNGARKTHGIAESQLSLMAWRSAVILNDVLERPRFAVERERELVRWSSVGASSR
ncbi:lysine N(6)-hydroxylase/L-ornithine N(5)-oxygenase family protein [Nannocystaceae bacterium ST9]